MLVAHRNRHHIWFCRFLKTGNYHLRDPASHLIRTYLSRPCEARSYLDCVFEPCYPLVLAVWMYLIDMICKPVLVSELKDHCEYQWSCYEPLQKMHFGREQEIKVETISCH